MKLSRLFIGDIFTLNKINFEYGPYFAPLSLSKTIYDIKFKKKTLLYKTDNYTFVDLCSDNSIKIKNSNIINQVNENEDFVMINYNLICFENELLNKDIKKKYISKCFVRKMVKKVK